MKKIAIIPRETRGLSKYNWLQGYHSFSFSHYFDPERMGIGHLRVLNDDTINPGTGFGTHPHSNMEIITIPLEGTLRHQDSLNNNFIIKAGEVQVMSAGSGIYHSEFNDSSNDFLKLLQIWIRPNIENTEPLYYQKDFSAESEKDKKELLLISPDGESGSLPIKQDAYITKIKLDDSSPYAYKRKAKGDTPQNVYIFVIKGDALIIGESVRERDALSITGFDEKLIDITKKGDGDLELLIFEC